MSEGQYIYLSGCFGGFLGLIAFVPVELIKCRAQNNTASKTNYRQEISKIIRKEGYFGLYRGYCAQFLREVPTMGIYFLSYNKYQSFFGVDPNK